METKKLTFPASESSGNVSALLMIADSPKALYILAHGAGGPMYSPGMQMIAESLAAFQIATFRYQFPYMEQSKKRPDPPGIAQATVRSAVNKVKTLDLKLPLFAGGKSFGGRMTSQAQANEPLPDVQGLIFYGFPLHAPGRASSDRAEHLFKINIPMLFLQGTRDALAKLELIKGVIDDLETGSIHILEGGDHSFKVPKSLERTFEHVNQELANAASNWIDSVIR